jgi:hypothetical protein
MANPRDPVSAMPESENGPELGAQLEKNVTDNELHASWSCLPHIIGHLDRVGQVCAGSYSSDEIWDKLGGGGDAEGNAARFHVPAKLRPMPWRECTGAADA